MVLYAGTSKGPFKCYVTQWGGGVRLPGETLRRCTFQRFHFDNIPIMSASPMKPVSTGGCGCIFSREILLRANDFKMLLGKLNMSLSLV